MIGTLLINAAIAALGLFAVFFTVACGLKPNSWPDAGSGALGSLVIGAGFCLCGLSCFASVIIGLLVLL